MRASHALAFIGLISIVGCSASAPDDDSASGAAQNLTSNQDVIWDGLFTTTVDTADRWTFYTEIGNDAHDEQGATSHTTYPTDSNGWSSDPMRFSTDDVAKTVTVSAMPFQWSYTDATANHVDGGQNIAIPLVKNGDSYDASGTMNPDPHIAIRYSVHVETGPLGSKTMWTQKTTAQSDRRWVYPSELVRRFAGVGGIEKYRGAYLTETNTTTLVFESGKAMEMTGANPKRDGEGKIVWTTVPVPPPTLNFP